VLVTGGSGRLGRSVVAGFADAGLTVTSADREIPELQDPRVSYRTADLTEPEDARTLLRAAAPHVVVGLAAIAVPFSAPEHVILSTNALIAHNTAAAAVEADAGRIVLASSPTVVGYGAPAGWRPDALPLTEETPARPWHAYGLSKFVAEQTIRMFAAQRGATTRFASFRPCFVIAPEEWAGAPTQQGHTVRERLDDPSLAAPSLFNYVDARDVTDFLLLLLDRMDDIPNGDTFFVGAPDALAREPLAQLLPAVLPEIGDLAVGLTGSRSAFSIEKARRLLGWEPTRRWRDQLAPASRTAPSADPGAADHLTSTGTPEVTR
jgi:nucleoside-diphosphate-sugar epimerase